MTGGSGPSKATNGDLDSSVFAAVCDLNGVYRGKKAPGVDVEKIKQGDYKLPLSTLFLDIWGRDVIASGQVLETGDIDGVLAPTARGVLPTPWKGDRASIIPLSMQRQDGSLYLADPRNALSKVLDRYAAKGLTPVCAAELEFYLYRRPGGDDAAPIAFSDGASAMYSLDALEDIEPVLNDIDAAAAAMDIPVKAAISESGGGQFEINLGHRSDALSAADDAQLLKYVIRGVAKKHGLGATFMAKPFSGEAGDGMHLHVSVVDSKGANIFDDGSEEGAPALRHAIGGALQTLGDAMLIFAPHGNSYRRLRAGSHAPTTLTWGYDNRTAAIRVPSGPHSARRFEHRVAGADTNPYLVFAAILGAALDGIERKTDPGPAIVGDAYARGTEKLSCDWAQAIAAFDASPSMRAIFDPFLVSVFAACKRQEWDTLMNDIPPAEHKAYLRTV